MNVRAGFLLGTGIAAFLFASACGDAGSPNLLAHRVEASFDVTAKVTYESTYDPEGTGTTNPISMTITQARQGRRVDSYFSPEGRTYTGSFLDLSDKQYMCNRYTGLDPDEVEDFGDVPDDQLKAWEDGFCYTSESVFGDSADDIFGPIFDFTFSFRETLREYAEEVEWEATTPRTIAGINADCYQVTSTDPETGGSDASEICFSDDDILLLIDVRSLNSPATITMLALEVDRNVREDDFALPYPVVDWPY